MQRTSAALGRKTSLPLPERLIPLTPLHQLVTIQRKLKARQQQPQLITLQPQLNRPHQKQKMAIPALLILTHQRETLKVKQMMGWKPRKMISRKHLVTAMTCLTTRRAIQQNQQMLRLVLKLTSNLTGPRPSTKSLKGSDLLCMSS